MARHRAPRALVRLQAEIAQLRGEIAGLQEHNQALLRVAGDFYTAGWTDALGGQPQRKPERHLRSVKAVVILVVSAALIARLAGAAATGMADMPRHSARGHQHVLRAEPGTTLASGQHRHLVAGGHQGPLYRERKVGELSGSDARMGFADAGAGVSPGQGAQLAKAGVDRVQPGKKHGKAPAAVVSYRRLRLRPLLGKGPVFGGQPRPLWHPPGRGGRVIKPVHCPPGHVAVKQLHRAVGLPAPGADALVSLAVPDAHR